ncbi:MAG: hypothetical protein JWO45_1842 [Spartobacteria bacterium]|nr:hypothetical protein [Spartobacteria bacterium]
MVQKHAFELPLYPSRLAMLRDNGEALMTKIPTTADGTAFDPVNCRRAGGYWVGPKGRQYKFSRFEEALAALNLMAKPRWRRPNSNGNWGIVSAAGWI